MNAAPQVLLMFGFVLAWPKLSCASVLPCISVHLRCVGDGWLYHCAHCACRGGVGRVDPGSLDYDDDF